MICFQMATSLDLSMLCYRDGVFRCQKCNYQCTFDRDALYHHDKHTYIMPRYECFVCNESVSSRKYMMDHLNRFHQPPYPDVCLLRVLNNVDGE